MHQEYNDMRIILYRAIEIRTAEILSVRFVSYRCFFYFWNKKNSDTATIKGWKETKVGASCFFFYPPPPVCFFFAFFPHTGAARKLKANTRLFFFFPEHLRPLEMCRHF